jgi:uncharacterized membrane protein
MKTLSTIILLVAISSTSATAESKRKEICQSPVSIACLKKNFEALYQDNVNVCTSAYKKHQDKALSCRDLKATTEYLGLAPVIENNAEISEDFGEVLGSFIIQKPTCFLNAASQLDDPSLKVLIKSFVINPPVADENKIKKIMQKHRKDPRYSKIISLYFSR